MLSQARLLLIDRLRLELASIGGLEVPLDLVEVFCADAGPGGAVDVAAGIVGAAWCQGGRGVIVSWESG